MNKILITFVLCFSMLHFYAQKNSDTIKIKTNVLGTTFYYKNNKANISKIIAISKNNKEANSYFVKASMNKTFTDIFSFAGGFLIGYPLGTSSAGGNPNWNLAFFGIGLITIAIPFDIAFVKKAKKGVAIFNQENITSFKNQNLKINFLVAFNKVGLKLSL